MTATAIASAETASVAPEGLTLSVYRWAGPDCTAGGVSSRFDKVTLVGFYRDQDKIVTPLPEHSQVHAATETTPAVALHLRTNLGMSLVPVEFDPAVGSYVVSSRWYMAGGNYAATCDSRFYDAIEAQTGQRFYGAIAVHDRYEG